MSVGWDVLARIGPGGERYGHTHQAGDQRGEGDEHEQPPLAAEEEPPIVQPPPSSWSMANVTERMQTMMSVHGWIPSGADRAITAR